MFVCIGGIPGVGKTTVIKKMLELHRELSIQGMNEIEILRQLAKVQSVKDYRELPNATRSKLRKKMYQRFYALDRKDPSVIRLLDIHFAWPQKNGAYFSRPIRSDDRKQILAIIVFVAAPLTIFRRRLYDVSHDGRDIENPMMIKRHQNTEIKIAISQAKALGIPFMIIKNLEGKLPRTSSVALSFVKNVQ